jgi:hypothetical protein
MQITSLKFPCKGFMKLERFPRSWLTPPAVSCSSATAAPNRCHFVTAPGPAAADARVWWPAAVRPWVGNYLNRRRGGAFRSMFVATSDKPTRASGC